MLVFQQQKIWTLWSWSDGSFYMKRRSCVMYILSKKVCVLLLAALVYRHGMKQMQFLLSPLPFSKMFVAAKVIW